MSNGTWSRGEKIAAGGLLIALVTCLAAIAVVPEVRHWFGLDKIIQSAKQSNEPTDASSPNNTSSNKSNENNDNEPQAGPGAAGPGASDKATTEKLPTKLTGIQFDQSVSTQFFYDRDLGQQTKLFHETFLRIKLLDLALYDNKKLYIKLSVCNVGNASSQVFRLYLWYTPPNGQDSLNWSWGGQYDSQNWFPLKASECKSIGAWSEKVDESFKLQRPLGILNISYIQDTVSGSIDLGTADSQKFVHFN